MTRLIAPVLFPDPSRAETGGVPLFEQGHSPLGAIHEDEVSILESLYRVARSNDSGNSVLSGDDSTMAKDPSRFRHEPADKPEKRRPRGGRRPSHKDVAGLKDLGLLDGLQNSDRSFCLPRRSSEANDLRGFPFHLFPRPDAKDPLELGIAMICAC